MSAIPHWVWFAVGAAIILIIIGALFKAMFQIPNPSEALLITGLGSSGPKNTPESVGFRIVIGHGSFVMPGFQSAKRLSLEQRMADFVIPCVTSQGIPVGVQYVILFKVGSDLVMIGNAAERFLEQQEKMVSLVSQIFEGHVRTIVGSLTVEELISGREAVSKKVRETSVEEMSKLGLQVDSLQIKELDDTTGYIKDLSQPHQAAIKRAARIAAANNDQQATEAEAKAKALMAEAQRDSAIKQASYTADVEKSRAESAQAGPLADAAARQAVIRQQTAAAELEAALTQQKLETSVRRPADAEAYRVTKQAEGAKNATIADAQAAAERTKLGAEAQAAATRATADAAAHQTEVQAKATAEARKATGLAEADATRAIGAAEGSAIKAKGEAEADAIKARASALAENQDAVINQQIAEHMAEIVGAIAAPLGNVGQMTMLNGASGITDVFGQVIGAASTLLPLAKQAFSTTSSATTPIETKVERIPVTAGADNGSAK